jgi:oligoendopeptidase F
MQYEQPPAVTAASHRWIKSLACAVVATVLLGAAPAASYQIDLTRYFPSAADEARGRVKLMTDAGTFIASATPTTPEAMLRWLQKFDALLKSVQRHDTYVYLRAEEDDTDTTDAKADDSLGTAADRIGDRVVQAAQQLGHERIASLLRVPSLAPFGYLLESSLVQAKHRLNAADARAVVLTVTPVLDAAAASYKSLRKSPDSIASRQDAYAALLVSIAAARNGVGRLRGFSGAAEASYFDKSIPNGSVDRTLSALRASTAYAEYLSVSAHAPNPGFTPPVLAISSAIPAILAAERPLGDEYASAYAALLNPKNHRLDICTTRQCDDTGFSVGFAGIVSAVYFGDYDGSVNGIRAVAHESGHAVHREFMSRNQPIAAYNEGPHFMFESFAIFNELLFLDHRYKSAPNDEQRAYYLNAFLRDATFQVFGSAEETELESAIYRGVDDRTIVTAADLNILASKVFARYDPVSKDPATALYWARDRLFFTDPLYDVNYLFAGLLAETYFTQHERDPKAFSGRYVALLKNGFTDTPANLERRFLGIDLTDEASLVQNAGELIDTRSKRLAKLFSSTQEAR